MWKLSVQCWVHRGAGQIRPCPYLKVRLHPHCPLWPADGKLPCLCALLLLIPALPRAEGGGGQGTWGMAATMLRRWGPWGAVWGPQIRAPSSLYHAQDLEWCPHSSFSLALSGLPLVLMGKGSPRVL